MCFISVIAIECLEYFIHFISYTQEEERKDTNILTGVPKDLFFLFDFNLFSILVWHMFVERSLF